MSKHIKLLLGGSPCTHWSIAQKNNRETEPGGLGWELFKNFLIAKEKFKPDYFLYENNKSAAQPIKDQISRELEVPLQYINSALVSAQNRQRFYAHNIPCVPQPQDRGILLKDILESGTDLSQNESGQGGKTGLYACPINDIEGKAIAIKAQYHKNNISNFIIHASAYGYKATGVAESWDGKTYPVYEVKNGLIEIKGKIYPIKLQDGFYIIRKLTVNECRRLQTIPDWYKMPCSASQNYKMLGNGWTIEIIKHILSFIPSIADCTVEVLSMYDGMSCGQIAITELGCKIERYVSYEIDKYCIQTTQMNFPKTEQRGDAFQLRNTNWSF